MKYSAIQREARESLLSSADEPPATEQESRISDTIELQAEEEYLTSLDGGQAEAAQVHKVRENRARRMADRRGLRVIKSRRRDPRALNYGEYMIVDQRSGGSVAGGTDVWDWLSLEQVEDWLLGKV